MVSEDTISYQTDFFIAPNKLFDEEITMKEKLILMYLIRCGNGGSQAFPSYNKIAEKCSMSRVTAIEAVKELTKKGYLVKEERFKGKENTSNIYRVTLGGKKFVPPPGTESEPPGKAPVPPSTESEPYKELGINNDIKKESFKDIVPQAEQVGFELEVPAVNNKAKIIEEVIHYLNLKVGKNFSPDTKETVKLISGRIKAGATLQDFKHVIDVKYVDWFGTGQAQYLRPSTLFNESKFEVYRQQSMVDVMTKPDNGYKNKTQQTNSDIDDLQQLFMNEVNNSDNEGRDSRTIINDQGGVPKLC